VFKKGLYYDSEQVKELTFQKGDYIYLFLQNLHLKRLSKKFNFKRYRLFWIKKKVATFNYKLNLPASIKV